MTWGPPLPLSFSVVLNSFILQGLRIVVLKSFIPNTLAVTVSQ